MSKHLPRGIEQPTVRGPGQFRPPSAPRCSPGSKSPARRSPVRPRRARLIARASRASSAVSASACMAYSCWIRATRPAAEPTLVTISCGDGVLVGLKRCHVSLRCCLKCAIRADHLTPNEATPIGFNEKWLGLCGARPKGGKKAGFLVQGKLSWHRRPSSACTPRTTS